MDVSTAFLNGMTDELRKIAAGTEADRAASGTSTKYEVGRRKIDTSKTGKSDEQIKKDKEKMLKKSPSAAYTNQR